MIIKKVKYIVPYDIAYYKHENRSFALSAKAMVDSILPSLLQTGCMVEIISPTWTSNTTGFYKYRKTEITKNLTLTLCSSFGAKNKLVKGVRIAYTLSWLIFYLMFNIKKDDIVIYYHAMNTLRIVNTIVKMKKARFIYEIAEVYADVSGREAQRKKEFKMFNNADAYIFQTELLNKKINTLNKPYAIIYGTYQVEEDRGVKFDDEKIHVVYAGIFDPRKGGALAAAAAAEFLPKNYHVHIIGFGSNDDKSMLLKKIDEISKITKATVTYDGLLRDEEYIQFLQKCHIGLSTQNPDAEYNDTSFPSKILSYMANGLRVVTVRIKAIESSAIGNMVYYYDKQNPKDIAEAIMSIDFNEPYDSRKIIKKLDEKFVKEIKVLLKA
jgi:glycosyltransferase involved in cell wall biosynthesis